MRGPTWKGGVRRTTSRRKWNSEAQTRRYLARVCFPRATSYSRTSAVPFHGYGCREQSRERGMPALVPTAQGGGRGVLDAGAPLSFTHHLPSSPLPPGGSHSAVPTRRQLRGADCPLSGQTFNPQHSHAMDFKLAEASSYWAAGWPLPPRAGLPPPLPMQTPNTAPTAVPAAAGAVGGTRDSSLSPPVPPVPFSPYNPSHLLQRSPAQTAQACSPRPAPRAPPGPRGPPAPASRCPGTAPKSHRAQGGQRG